CLAPTGRSCHAGRSRRRAAPVPSPALGAAAAALRLAGRAAYGAGAHHARPYGCRAGPATESGLGAARDSGRDGDLDRVPGRLSPGVALAPSKLHYLKRNWLTAVAVVLPTLRAVRVLRVARALRGMSLLRLLTTLNRGSRALGHIVRR